MGEVEKSPGIYYGVSMEEYRSWRGVHKSMFSSVLRSGLHLKHFLEKGEPENDAMRFGNIVDTILFEPSLFESRYAVAPKTYPAVVKKVEVEKPWNWNATFCQDWRDSQPEGVTITSEKEISEAKSIVSKISTHPEASKWLSGSAVQVSMVWIDPDTGLYCKGRLDAEKKNERLIDLKITNDPFPFAFSGIMNRFKYHAQAAFYHDGYLLAQGKSPSVGPEIPFSFIVCEDSAPFDVIAYNIGVESFEAGRIVYREALSKYNEIVESGEYSGYSNVAEEIEIPHWALNKIQLEGIVE